MKRLGALLLLMMICIPSASQAIQLHWSNGADTLSFAAATRCVLILRSDSTEALPAEWRLAWLGDSLGINFVEGDSLEACDLDTPTVSQLDSPITLADSAAHLLTAQFCSESGPAALRAYYVLDQPGGSRGRLKVVALDPNDPEQVLESNEVTFNGGLDGTYAPVLLSATSTRETALLRVSVVGWGLDSVQTMRIGAPDDLWSVLLTIDAQDSTGIEASAEISAVLPEAVVQVTTQDGASDLAWLPAEVPTFDYVASSGVDTIQYVDPNPSVYPKDFAFHYNAVYDPTEPDPERKMRGVFHLFYIRNKAGLDSIIAHAWTDSLGKPWSVDTMAFRPSGAGWDAKRVWAPSIQQVGNLYYMFYTGVDAAGHQSIGYATTPELGRMNIPWTRRSTPSYTSFDTDWADEEGHHVPGVRQFRDPFVMPDPSPAYPGRYLLFNAGEDRNLFPRYTIGVARNRPGTLQEWENLGNYEATDHNHLPVSGALESPLVVRDSLTGAWRMFVANADYDGDGYYSTIFLTQSPGDSVTHRTAAAWPDRDSLYAYLDNDLDVIGWQACEHLQIGQAHFFAGYEGKGIGITRMHWDPDLQKFIIAYPSVAGVDDEPHPHGFRLRLAELRLGAGMVRFAIESEHAITPQLTVYDITGRRVRRLTDGRTLHGHSEITWDCRDESGSSSATGVYFARLTSAGRSQVVRVPIIR